jgi:hypothetical protein
MSASSHRRVSRASRSPHGMVKGKTPGPTAAAGNRVGLAALTVE